METINKNGITTDVRETAMNSYSGSETSTIFSEERKWINKVLRWKEEYPDEVTIQNYDEKFGSIVASVPQSWMKMSPKRKDTLTPEQKKALAERMRNMRSSSKVGV